MNAPDTATGAAGHPVRRVLYVAKTHLDVGFTAPAAQVRRRYLDDFFPRALQVAEQLRRRGGTARLRWTTGSWILTEALDEADGPTRRRLEAAIEQGDLCWHALPFTTHTEYADRSLLAHGLSLSAALDRRFGRRTRAAKATDVPGHTRALIGVLADAGVQLLHVGVNPVAAVPQVPMQFRWRDPSPRGSTAGGAEVLVMYQPGGYGDVQVIEGSDVAVAVDLTGDNLGPRSAHQVTEAFDRLARRFPGAVVQAATLDDVAEVMGGVVDSLPLVDAEIGDTWVHGTGSDPMLTAGFRALSRQRADWLARGAAQSGEPALRRASTRLLLVAEHTWGLDQKTHWPDTEHWSADELARVRHRADTVAFEASWADRHRLLDDYVQQLLDGGRADLADAARACLDASRAEPSRELPPGAREVHVHEPVVLGPFVVELDRSGSVVRCDGPDGRAWSDAGRPLLAVAQQTVDAGDYERWYRSYNASVTEPDEWWARWDNTKPGLEHSGARSAWWPSTLQGCWSAPDADVLVIDQRIDAPPDAPVAAPERYRTTLRWNDEREVLEIELSWWRRPAARWPGVTWWRVAPVVHDPSRWVMHKSGATVSPMQVVDGGGRWWHVAERLDHPEGVSVDLVDTGLVSPGTPRTLQWDPGAPVDPGQGWHLAVLANLWGTNFPMWVEGAGRARVGLRLPIRPG